MSFIEDLKWRYAVKQFDSEQQVSENNLNFIREAVRLSASSYGLQPYTIIEIKDSNLRSELKEISWNQSQVTDASHLLLFCNHVSVTPKDVDFMIKEKSSLLEMPEDKLAEYGTFINSKLELKSELEMFHWTAKQTYIALTNAMVACAELGIDAAPLEGFNNQSYNERLNLQQSGLNACVLLAVGYRSKDDANQHKPKYRKSLNQLFRTL